MDIKNEIINRLIEKQAKTPEDLAQIKKDIAKKYKASFPTNVSLLEVYHKKGGKDESILSILKTRPVRSLSGVVNISVLTKPFPCPGECIYCPEEEGAPKSYLTNEPAVMRAVLSEYDPFRQTQMRIKSLGQTGHPTNKIELRVIGATWSYYKEDYRQWFIKRCFDACNKKESASLREAQKRNESSKHRIVCLSIETRPDFINKKEIVKLREYGVTMVELGVQSLSDDVLSFTKRGHQTKETITATKMLKNAGFKVCYQMMMNLPGCTPKEDIATFQELFENPFYRPDFLKLYPCLILKNAPLYELYQKGDYKPFTDKELIETIIEIKKRIIPPYVRIQRLFRDIPVPSIVGSCKISNLREKIQEDERKNNWSCKCIRCREVKGSYDEKEEVFFFREDYEASSGKEIFLSLENKEKTKLFALLRLRITKETDLSVLKDSAILREIRTYGQHISVKEKRTSSPQHKGMGKRLIKEAEEIAKNEFDLKKMTVISGVGVRDYWRKLGYRLRETYMIKSL